MIVSMKRLAGLAVLVGFMNGGSLYAQVYGAQGYNPYTGNYARAAEGYNPYTGASGATRSAYNPYSGARATAGGAYNPYTGGGKGGGAGGKTPNRNDGDSRSKN